VLAKRPAAKDKAHDRLAFLTIHRRPWVTVRVAADPYGEAAGEKGRLKIWRNDELPKMMRKLLDRLDINGQRNFNALRHMLETIGSESGGSNRRRSYHGPGRCNDGRRLP
jgi:hypothetical protein